MQIKKVALLVILISGSFFLRGQDIAGNWEGTLNVENTPYKIVFHILSNEGQYKGTMDSPDQKVSGIPVSVVDFSYPKVRLEIKDIGMIYEGTIDKLSINGNWKQAGRIFSLVVQNVQNNN